MRTTHSGARMGLVLAMTGLLLLAGHAGAEIIGGYSFSNHLAQSTSPAPPNDQPEKVTFSSFARGAGLATGSEGGTGFVKASDFNEGTDLVSAMTATNYFTFTLTPWPGCSMSITGMTFREGGIASGPRNWGVATSLDGFSTTVGSGGAGKLEGIDPNRSLPPTNLRHVVFGPGFADLVDPLEIRIAGWTADTPGGFWCVDEIMLHGTRRGHLRRATGAYSLTDANPKTTRSFPVDAQPPVVEFSDLVRGHGLNNSSITGTNFMSAASWTNRSYAAAIADGDYYSFTVRVARASASIWLTDLRFDQSISSSGPTDWGIGTSLDDFAEPRQVGKTFFLGSTTPPSEGQTDMITFPNLQATDSVEIRIAGWNASGSGGYFSIDNVTLGYGYFTSSGTVMVVR